MQQPQRFSLWLFFVSWGLFGSASQLVEENYWKTGNFLGKSFPAFFRFVSFWQLKLFFRLYCVVRNKKTIPAIYWKVLTSFFCLLKPFIFLQTLFQILQCFRSIAETDQGKTFDHFVFQFYFHFPPFAVHPYCCYWQPQCYSSFQDVEW